MRERAHVNKRAGNALSVGIKVKRNARGIIAIDVSREIKGNAEVGLYFCLPAKNIVPPLGYLFAARA
jgi:hypothetical protein